VPLLVDSPPDRPAVHEVAKVFREVRVYEIREILRLWLRGKGLRSIEGLTSVDRKTVRRYVTAAIDAGLLREGGEDQLSDSLMASVCERVRPHRPTGHGAAWALLVTNHDQLKVWLADEGLTAVKAHELFVRRGIVVPERTLHRYALEVRGAATVAESFLGRLRGAQLALINGAAGGVWAPGGQPRVVFAFTIRRGRITAIELIGDSEWLGHLDLAILDQ
jgi:hypothetical protein